LGFFCNFSMWQMRGSRTTSGTEVVVRCHGDAKFAAATGDLGYSAGAECRPETNARVGGVAPATMCFNIGAGWRPGTHARVGRGGAGDCLLQRWCGTSLRGGKTYWHRSASFRRAPHIHLCAPEPAPARPAFGTAPHSEVWRRWEGRHTKMLVR
jgi:hypothetical protein